MQEQAWGACSCIHRWPVSVKEAYDQLGGNSVGSVNSVKDRSALVRVWS